MKTVLLRIVQDIIALRLSGYDLAPLQGISGLRRIRKGKIRIIFAQEKNMGIIKKIDMRGDVYKGI